MGVDRSSLLDGCWAGLAKLTLLVYVVLLIPCQGDIWLNVTKEVDPPDNVVACENITIWINVTPEGEPCNKTLPVYAVLVIDTSHSMSYVYGNKSILDYIKNASTHFVERMNFTNGDKVGIISYDSHGHLIQSLTNNSNEAIASIEALSPGVEWKGGTNMGEGIRLARQELEKVQNDSTKAMILFTDGIPTTWGQNVNPDCILDGSCSCENCPVSDNPCINYTTNQSEQVDNDTRIFTTGWLGAKEDQCGSNVTDNAEDLLKQIASCENYSYIALNLADLDEIYAKITDIICDSTVRNVNIVDYVSPHVIVKDEFNITSEQESKTIEFFKDHLTIGETWNIQINGTVDQIGEYKPNLKALISYTLPNGTRIENDTINDTPTINVTYPLNVSKFGPEEAVPCEEFNYTICLEHIAEDPLYDVKLIDFLPENVSYQSHHVVYVGSQNASTLDANYSISTHLFTINTTEPFLKGDKITCNITVELDRNASGTLIEKMTVTYTRPECVVDAAINATTEAKIPDISITKEASIDRAKIGDIIQYNVTVTNIGMVWLKVNVTDELIGLSEQIDLDPGTSQSFLRDYVVTEVDICGDIFNRAMAIGNTLLGTKVGPVNATVNVTTYYDANFTITKTANPSENVSIGETIVYTITVENTGDVNLTDIQVEDSLTNEAWNVSLLKPGEKNETLLYYVVTDQSPGIYDGWINNTVTAEAKDPFNETKKRYAYTNVSAKYYSNFTITKIANPSENVSISETIVYTITIENTGDVNLTDIQVEDSLTNETWNVSLLKPGEKNETLLYYVVTDQSPGIYDGWINNTVTAEAKDPFNETKKRYAYTNVSAKYYSNFTITKIANPSENVSIGETIVYTITIENTGDVNLTDIQVEDSLTNEAWNISLLEPGEKNEALLYYVVTDQSPGIYDGWINNTVTAEAKDPFNETKKRYAYANVSTRYHSNFTVTKTANPSENVSIGETIVYTFVIENTGNANLTDIQVEDFLTNETWNVSLLKPGEKNETLLYYVVTDQSPGVCDGWINNTVKAEVTDARNETKEQYAYVNVTIEYVSGLLLNKEVRINNANVTLNDIVSYSISVSNPYNVTLYDVVVKDELLKLDEQISELGPRDIKIFEINYTVTEEDICCEIENKATAEAKDTCGNIRAMVTSCTTHTYYTPSLEVNEVANVTTAEPGDVVRFDIIVKNTGNVNLKDILAKDILINKTWTISLLRPSERWETHFDYTIKEEGGDISDTVTAKGIAPCEKVVNGSDRELVQTKSEICEILNKYDLDFGNQISMSMSGDGAKAQNVLTIDTAQKDCFRDDLYDEENIKVDDQSASGFGDGKSSNVVKVKSR